MNIDQLVDFLDTNGHHDAVWWKWFEEKYCNQCESVIVTREEYKNKFGCSGYGNTVRCAYCEWNNGCRFFPETDDVPDSKETIKLWLESEVEK